MTRLVLALALLAPVVAGSLEAQRRTEPDAFTWSGRIPNGRWITIRNMNGTVDVSASTTDRVEVTATRTTRRGDPEYVRFEVKKSGAGEQDVLVCALWGDNANCDETGYRSRTDGRHGNEVVVAFHVRVPAGVKVGAYSTNGEVRVRDVTAEVDASTTNGSVTVTTSSGPVNASTTNGSVRAIMGNFDMKSDMTFTTTNGSVIVSFADDLNAEVDLRTVNGRFLSDYPVTISGRIDPRRLRATLGKGGPRLRLSTVNGNVELRRR
ncbi:MAG TPA: DUF4097 family beta strand repeat-containing protein [Gemmatimonadaceae bacterium]|nr:DUF4097 family beta strand repeat-containing protein [Gemmatimonadaceae bacterium]